MLSSYRAQKRSDRKLIVSYTKPGAASVKDIYMSPLACKGGYILTDAGVCKVDAESRSDGIDCTPVQLQHLADQLKNWELPYTLTRGTHQCPRVNPLGLRGRRPRANAR